MAGKNTAAFGIYPNQIALEEGVVALREANFRSEDVSILYPANEGTKDFGHEKATKAPEGRRQAPAQGQLSAVFWDGSQELARLLFQESVLLSQPVLSLRPSPVWAPAVSLAELPALSSVSASRNTKRSAMTAA